MQEALDKVERGCPGFGAVLAHLTVVDLESSSSDGMSVEAPGEAGGEAP